MYPVPNRKAAVRISEYNKRRGQTFEFNGNLTGIFGATVYAISTWNYGLRLCTMGEIQLKTNMRFLRRRCEAPSFFVNVFWQI